MWVEALDAVNVTPDGIDVATSLNEMVAGKPLAEVAVITVWAVACIE